VKAVEQPASTKESYTVKLQINEGPIDRGIRIVIGIALLAAAAAIVGFCPLYAILRLSTVSARR
jgi:hypothetical protein